MSNRVQDIVHDETSYYYQLLLLLASYSSSQSTTLVATSYKQQSTSGLIIQYSVVDYQLLLASSTSQMMLRFVWTSSFWSGYQQLMQIIMKEEKTPLRWQLKQQTSLARQLSSSNSLQYHHTTKKTNTKTIQTTRLLDYQTRHYFTITVQKYE